MKPLIVLQTDFSLDWPFVSTMKGVIKGVDPSLEIIDSCHTIEKFSVLEASQQLNYIEPFYTKGTVIVSVVDPGVGTARKASCALLKDGTYVITPDNGTLTHLYYNVGIQSIREIKHRYQGTENVSVFHGRDIFAYTAALLASGDISYEEVGTEYSVDEVILLDSMYLQAEVNDSEMEGIVSNVSDPFGSIVFNILTDDFMKYYKIGEWIDITLLYEDNVYFADKVLYADSFGSVKVKEPVIFNSSSNYISIGLNQGSFKDTYNVKTGKDWKVRISKI